MESASRAPTCHDPVVTAAQMRALALSLSDVIAPAQGVARSHPRKSLTQVPALTGSLERANPIWFRAIKTARVTMLRSRGDRRGRFHKSPTTESCV